jgi:type IX secretion system PorP/SprF family membrane protein
MQHTKLPLLGILFAIATFAQAQDVLFTQFAQAPLTLNPALAGHFEGNYRVGVVYRNQWANIGKAGAFSTPSVFADLNILDAPLRGSLGVGLQVTNDESFGGKVTNVGANLSVAYHLALDVDEKYQFLSFGVQGGVLNQRIKTTDLTFASQFDGDKIDPTRASGEAFDRTSTTAPDLSAGLLYALYFDNGGHIEAGAAYKHLLTATPAYEAGITATMPSLAIGHITADLPLGKVMSLHPSVLYAAQAHSTQLNANMLLGFHLNPDNAIYVGGGIRTGDAILAMLRLQLNTVNIGLAYDLNNSSLAPVTQGQGAWELSLNFSGSNARREGSVRKSKAVIPPVRYY